MNQLEEGGVPGELTDCGTYRWCAKCGLKPVGKDHEDQLCFPCWIGKPTNLNMLTIQLAMARLRYPKRMP